MGQHPVVTEGLVGEARANQVSSTARVLDSLMATTALGAGHTAAQLLRAPATQSLTVASEAMLSSTCRENTPQ